MRAVLEWRMGSILMMGHRHHLMVSLSNHGQQALCPPSWFDRLTMRAMGGYPPRQRLRRGIRMDTGLRRYDSGWGEAASHRPLLLHRSILTHSVIPAKAGIQYAQEWRPNPPMQIPKLTGYWIPACAGMTWGWGRDVGVCGLAVRAARP